MVPISIIGDKVFGQCSPIQVAIGKAVLIHVLLNLQRVKIKLH